MAPTSVTTGGSSYISYQTPISTIGSTKPIIVEEVKKFTTSANSSPNKTSFPTSPVRTLNDEEFIGSKLNGAANNGAGGGAGGNKSLDDLIKDRFQKQQGVRDQNTGRYVPNNDESISVSISSQPAVVPTMVTAPIPVITPAPTKYAPKIINNKTNSSGHFDRSNTVDMSSSNYKKIEIALSKADDDKKLANNKFQRSSGSLSDADIIFGDIKAAVTATPPPSAASTTSSSRNVNSRFSSFNSSISTESENIYDPNGAYKSTYDYQGVQNKGFQDSTSTSGGSGRRWNDTASDEFDLK